MDKDTAENIAKKYIIERMVKNLQLTLHEEPQSEVAIYNFNPADEYLFYYTFGHPTGCGGSNYITVSRSSGKVLSTGVLGE
jgi:hypothetical protein